MCNNIICHVYRDQSVVGRSSSPPQLGGVQPDDSVEAVVDAIFRILGKSFLVDGAKKAT